jgi:hypothetical protein
MLKATSIFSDRACPMARSWPPAASEQETILPDAPPPKSARASTARFSWAPFRSVLVQARFAGLVAVAACGVLLGAQSMGPTQANAEPARPVATTQVAPITQTDPTILTGPLKRHPDVKSVAEEMAESAKRGAASATVFLPGNDTPFKTGRYGFGTGIPRWMDIVEPPKDGILRGTIVVNVSGHSHQAEQYARTNTYSVRIELPDGRVLLKTGIPRNVVKDPSQSPNTAEYATTIDVEFPYQLGITKLSAWPDGSLGSGGNIEGRMYKIHSHDQPA